MPLPEAIELVKAAAKVHPRKLAGVADALGYSRPALSRYVNGSYGGAEKLEAAIFDRYQGVRACPHNGEHVPVSHCRLRAHAPEPFGGAARHAQWQACQRCPYKPTQEIKP
jgi:hypothetical protein